MKHKLANSCTPKLLPQRSEVLRDHRLNQSRGTTQAYDLLDLSEDEVVGLLGEFGVVGAKRFTREKNGKVENTATTLLTFERPSCPPKLQLDYVTYHVHQYIPSPGATLCIPLRLQLHHHCEILQP